MTTMSKMLNYSSCCCLEMQQLHSSFAILSLVKHRQKAQLQVIGTTNVPLIFFKINTQRALET